MELPLVPMTKNTNPKVHPYPCQIAMQTRRFIQGSVFHSALADFGAGQFFRTPDAYLKAKTDFVSSGMSNDTWEISWECFEEYTKAFPNPVYQGALFSMNVHWDWFIARLGKFVEFGRKHTELRPESWAQKSRCKHNISYTDLRIPLSFEGSRRQVA